VHALLHDRKPTVRLRIALALGRIPDAAAVPVLIDLMAELPPAPRKPAEDLLKQLAGEWAPALALAGEDEISRRIRRDAWAAWWRHTEGPLLVAELRKRTLSEADQEKIRSLAAKLNHASFHVRERAAAELVEIGTFALPPLRQAAKGPDPELARRADQCIRLIQKAGSNPLPSVALRLLALRRPPGAVAALLAYLPYAESQRTDEVQAVLAQLAFRDGTADPALLEALGDKLPLRRASAAEVLGLSPGAEHRPALCKLLADPEPSVRLRVALLLAGKGERTAVPVLIALLAELPWEDVWPVEDLLCRLAGDLAPALALGQDGVSAAKCRDAWAAWWRDQGASVDLAMLDAARASRRTLLVLRDANNVGHVRMIGADGKALWAIGDLDFPVDAHLLDGDRVLIAELQGQRVTERDLKGKVLWEKALGNLQVVAVQRLRNGNTFIVTRSQLLEVDRDGKTVFTHVPIANASILAGAKARNGHVCYTTAAGTCTRLDSTGKELKAFNVGSSTQGGLELLPSGRLLLTKNSHRVVEIDTAGKIVWQVSMPSAGTATRLANGNTLIASDAAQRVVEVDRAGNIVWEHKDGNRPWRARRY
jgi:HEAT repeat protein